MTYGTFGSRRCGRIVIATVALLMLGTTPPVTAQEPSEAGRVRVTSGTAFIVRSGQTLPAQAGQSVFEGDRLRTGADGSLGITFRDDTRLSLGPGTNVDVAQYAFAPAEGRLGLMLSVLRGAVAYVSGRLAKLAPDSVRLETPAAIVGVRGTSLAISVEAP